MFYNLLFRLNISSTSFHVILSKEYVISQYMNIIMITNSICINICNFSTFCYYEQCCNKNPTYIFLSLNNYLYEIHEIKTCLLLRRKAMPNLDSILKSRGITLPTKVHIVRAWFFQ